MIDDPQGTDKAKIAAAVEKMAKAGASPEEIETYIASTGLKPVAEAGSGQIHRLAQRPGGMERLRQNVKDQNDAAVVSSLEELVGTAGSAAQAIPGAERAGVALRSLKEGVPYETALKEVRTAEEETPAALTESARLAASMIPAAGLARLGTTAAKGGALLGASDAALSADEEPLGERALRTGVGAGLGSLFSKALSAFGTAGRAAAAKTGGTQALETEGKIAAADAENYPKAEAQAKFAKPSEKLTSAMRDPDIVPYVKTARSLRAMKGKPDGLVAMEAYKFMVDEEAALEGKIAANQASNEERALYRNLGDMKAQLGSAIAEVAPDFPAAVVGHAEKKGVQEAAETASDATRRAMGAGRLAASKEKTLSPEALAKKATEMTQDEKDAATARALGRAKQFGGLETGKKLFKPFGKQGKVADILRDIDPKKQSLWDALAAVIGGEPAGTVSRLGRNE